MDVAKLPVGIQTFSEIRTRNQIYVDKTDLVYRLANLSKYNFLSRPRRFGKSLLLSTLQAYFEGRRELFCGLKIESLEKDWAQYPVLRFDMNNGMFRNPNGVDYLLDNQLSKYEQTYGVEVTQPQNLSGRFENLIRKAFQMTGRRVVVLVDEYEKPILETINNPQLQEIHRGALKPFYATIKSCDNYIRFVMLTGVTKMGHLSVFSDLNNVMNQTLNPDFASICGFTKEQIYEYFTPFVEKLSQNYHYTFDETIELLEKHYDGYRFSRGDCKVFNPFSLLSAFFYNCTGDYWFETGTPSFLVNVLRHKQFRINELEGLAAQPEELTEVDDNYSSPVPLLYQCGYLTIKNYDAQFGDYTLGYPNLEVRSGLLKSLLPNYLSISPTDSNREIRNITRATLSGDVESIMQSIQTLITSIPSSPREVYEYLYRDSVYLIFKILGLNVHSEVSILTGRVDCVVEVPGYVYIFEFKTDSTAQEALDQIMDKGYAMPYMNTGRKIFTIGVNFDIDPDSRRMTYVTGA